MLFLACAKESQPLRAVGTPKKLKRDLHSRRRRIYGSDQLDEMPEALILRFHIDVRPKSSKKQWKIIDFSSIFKAFGRILAGYGSPSARGSHPCARRAKRPTTCEYEDDAQVGDSDRSSSSLLHIVCKIDILLEKVGNTYYNPSNNICILYI